MEADRPETEAVAIATASCGIQLSHRSRAMRLEHSLARSMPMIIALSIEPSPFRRFCNGHPGTLRCRREGASTQSSSRKAIGAMAIRRETIEHLFLTIKAWMGARHFLLSATSGADRRHGSGGRDGRGQSLLELAAPEEDGLWARPGQVGSHGGNHEFAATIVHCGVRSNRTTARHSAR
jgi:hypothetical protein